MESSLSFKIIIIGESGTGKSCLLLKFIDKSFEHDFNSTIGVDFRFRNIIINDNFVKLCIWDTAGQERFQSIIRNYYTGIGGIILVFDLNVRYTFDKLSYWVNEIKSVKKDYCPVILVGNKSDIKKTTVSSDEINDFIEKSGMNMKYFEVSVKKGINVNVIFEELTKRMVDNAVNHKNLLTTQNKQNLQTNNQSYLCCSVS